MVANDSDPDGDPITATLLSYPAYGSLSNVGWGRYSYSRTSSTWTGTDSFTYKACDNQSACSSPATVTIDVVNQAPTAVDDSYNIHGYTQIGPFRANDSDPDGDPLTYTRLTWGETTQFPSYDDDGNLLQRIDGNSVVTNYFYSDAESSLTDIQYPATPGLNVHFTYDGFGRRSTMTGGTGSHSYTYGNLDELLTASTTYTGLAAKTISYTYYVDGSKQAITTPAGTFNYSYDAGGRPSSMINPFSETTSWAYLNNDWLQTQTLANGATANYTRNAMGQVTRLLNQLSGNTISDFSSIAYDGAGSRASVTASIPAQLH